MSDAVIHCEYDDALAIPDDIDVLPELNYLITEGPHIGNVEQTSAEIVPPAKLEAHLLRIGNDGTFFEEV